VQNGDQRPDEPFWPSLWDRIKFFAKVLLEIVIDSFYLVLVYVWTRIVGNYAGKFEPVEGYELLCLIVLKFTLTVLPTILVVWYVVVDCMGAVRRIWERRKWLKAGRK
jgi:hypothetical protein